MKPIFYPICLMIFFISCNRHTIIVDEPSPNDKNTIHTYLYKKNYTVPEIHFYRGGESPTYEVINEEQAQKYIIPSFDIFTLDEITIDFDKMRLQEVKGSFMDDKNISITNDSLYYVENGKKTFNGVVEFDKSRYYFFRTYYFYRFQNENIKLESSGSVHGVLGEKDVFQKDNLLFENKAYGFAAPSEMKNKNDIVCWVVVRYTLERK